jgi:hypothetical protein
MDLEAPDAVRPPLDDERPTEVSAVVAIAGRPEASLGDELSGLRLEIAQLRQEIRAVRGDLGRPLDVQIEGLKSAVRQLADRSVSMNAKLAALQARIDWLRRPDGLP